MATLAANALRVKEIGDVNAHPVVGSDIIYAWAAVGFVAASGLARPLQAGDVFAGFAEEKADNSAGADGAINVRVWEKGKVELDIAGLAAANVGSAVYASDDDTFTLTATGNSYIGNVSRVVAAGRGVVAFAALERQAP